MKPNSLFAVLAVLAVLAFLPESGVDNKSTRNLKLMGNLDPQSVHSIELEPKLGEKIVIVKKADIWKVDSYNNFPADPNKVSKFLQNLFLLKMGDKETSGSKYYENYGVSLGTKVKGTLLSLKDSDGNILKSVVFGNDRMGKSQYGFDTPVGQYMRLKDQENIYLLKERFSLEVTASNWIHKKLPSLSKDEIQKISVSSGSKTFELSRLESKSELKLAKLGASEVMNSAKVNELVGVMQDFSFNNLEKPNSQAAMMSMTNLSSLEFSTFDGMRLSVEMGVKTTASSYRFAKLKWTEVNPSPDVKAKVVEYNKLYDGWLVGITDYSSRNLFPKRDDLISIPPLGAKHILLAYEGASNSKAQRTKSEALELANKVLADIKSGQKFEDMAKQYSDDSSNKLSGGDLGKFKKGDMVKTFEEATVALKVGETTESPVETVYGYHIIHRTQ